MRSLADWDVPALGTMRSEGTGARLVLVSRREMEECMELERIQTVKRGLMCSFKEDEHWGSG